MMAIRKPRILCFNPVRHALKELESLRKVASVEVVSSESREEFFQDAARKYKDVDAIYRTSASGAVSGVLSQSLETGSLIRQRSPAASMPSLYPNSLRLSNTYATTVQDMIKSTYTLALSAISP